MEDYPGWGLIQHVNTKKYLSRRQAITMEYHPYTKTDYDYNSLFSILQDFSTIRHISGQTFHPINDNTIPLEGNFVKLDAGTSAATKFTGRDAKNKLANVHSTKIPAGHWELMIQRINPIATYEESLTVTNGFEKTKEMTADVTFGLEVEASFAGIGTTVSYEF